MAGTYHYQWDLNLGRRVRVPNIVLQPVAAPAPGFGAIALPPKRPDFQDVALPVGVRFIHKKGRYAFYIMELRPAVRRILFDFESKCRGEDGKYRGKEFHEVSTPWTYLTAVIHDKYFFEGQAAWSPVRLKVVEDAIYKPQLPNVYEEHFDICMGGTLGGAYSGIDSAEALARNFYESAFNNHATHMMNIPPKYKDIAEWAADSLIDPACYKTWEWEKFKKGVLNSGTTRHIYYG